MSFSIFLFPIAHLQTKKKPHQTAIFRISAQHFCPVPSTPRKTWNTVGTSAVPDPGASASRLAWHPCLMPHPSPLCLPGPTPPRLPALFTYGPGILVTTALQDLTRSASRSFQLQVPLPTASTPGIPAFKPPRNCYNVTSRHFLEKGKEDLCVLMRGQLRE